MSETILTISHLRKDFGSNQVLKDVDFQVEKGDVTCIIGASGSGKSTLVHLLDRLYDVPEGQGRITIGGVDVSAISDRERRRCIGCVEQHFSRVPGTVLDQITLGDPQITEEMARKYTSNVKDFETQR